MREISQSSPCNANQRILTTAIVGGKRIHQYMFMYLVACALCSCGSNPTSTALSDQHQEPAAPVASPPPSGPASYPHRFWDLACVHVYYMPKEIMEAVDFLTLDRDMDPAKFSGTANYVQPDEKGNILAYMLVMDNLKIRRDDKAFSKDYENSLHRGSFEYASYMNNLGALSYCEKDFARAHTCYLAASQTLLFPNIMLGIMSENGQGCLQDYADALHKYEIAAKSGNPIAENFLGVALLNGKLTDVDVGRGRRLIASSAEKTYPIAQTNLGILCLLGIGGDKDIIQAHKWMNLASQGELGAPKLILDYLTKQMSPDQIRQAQSLAREFRDRTPASGVPGASSSADNHN